MIKKKWLLWLWAGILAAIAAGALAWRFTRPNPALSYGYKPAECLTYQLDYNSVSAADFQSLFESLESARTNERISHRASDLFQSFRTELRGELIATVLDRSAERFIISFRIHDPVLTLDINGEDAPLQAEITSVALRLDVFAEFDLKGRIKVVYFDPEVDSFSRNLARALMAQTQFVLPARSAARITRWETEEEDPNGRCIARYELVSGKKKHDLAPRNGQLQAFVKTKISYLNPSAQTKLAATAIPTSIIPRGNLAAVFDLKSGNLVSLDGSEEQVIKIAGKIVGQATNRLRLKFLDKEVVSSDERQAMLEAYRERKTAVPGISLAFALSDGEREAIIQRSELGEATIESLLADLARAEKEGKRHDTSLYLKFKALIYLHPEACGTLGQQLITAEAKSLTMSVISDALGVVGHEQAQETLVNAIQARPNEPSVLTGFIHNLSLAESPSIPAENTLWDLADNSRNKDVAETAQLSLGKMARSLALKSPERANKIVDRFVREIRLSGSEEKKRLLLLVLGNSGSSRAFPTLNRFLSDPSPSLRAAAAASLRWIDSSEVDNLLANILTSDPNASVRLESAFALSFRQPVDLAIQAQKKAFLEDEAVIVRLSVLRNLWQMHKDFPEVLQLVKQAAANDPSEDVRKAAAEIIAAYPEDYFK